VATAAWAGLYVLAAVFDWQTVRESWQSGTWLDLLNIFSIGAIGVVSVAALAIEYRTRQKAKTED
jgi:hypothetical protein